MRFIEINRLNEYISSLKSRKSSLSASLSDNLSEIDAISLQDFSVKQDMSFLSSVSSLLSIILTIITHPHISNRTEEVVIRIEQAQRIDHETFVNTIKESRFWKKHGIKMIPEELYYYQHEDELKIYENKFIVLLVNLLDRELSKYGKFYLTRLPSLSQASLIDGGSIGDIILTIDRLKRKITYVKGTYFYKTISREKPISPKIQPTNILLKDRLYKYCFRFYRSFISFEDIQKARANLQSFYLILILKSLIARGFRALEHSGERFVLANPDFDLQIDNFTGKYTLLTVSWHENPEKAVKHRLYFDVGYDDASPAELESEREISDTLSLWQLDRSAANGKNTIYTGSEAEIIEKWLSEKMTTLPLQSPVYKKYCPVCKSKETDSADGLFVCHHCRSEYVSSAKQDSNLIWIRKFRK